MFLKRLLYYLDVRTMFQKSQHSEDEDTGKRVNMGLMHGINRISLFLFLICLIIMLFKFVL